MVTPNTEKEPRYPRRPGFSGHKPEENESNRIPEATEKPPSNNALVAEMRIADAKESRASGRKMVERKAPILFEFKAPGDLLEGELLSVDKIKITDRDTKQPKLVMQYTFVGESDTFKCLGTYDLNTKLRPSDVGLWVEIVFMEVDASKNNMRVFSVKIEDKSKNAAHFADGQKITDDDIPF
jgi:hypothetical protein